MNNQEHRTVITLSDTTRNNLSDMIYLDNQATTAMDPRVLQAMIPYFSVPTNPHSRNHAYGWNAEDAVNNARKDISSLLNCLPEEIIFTSGATEANNIAIVGAYNFHKFKHVITVKTEHKCVLESVRYIESLGCKSTLLDVQSNGIIDLNNLESAITPETGLVSVMFANNEIGVIQPILEIGEICKRKGVLFHVDAAQAFGKIPIDVRKMNISLLSISGHKIYGPMGIGALFVSKKPKVRLKAIFNGGGQERNLRSGTVPTPLVVGFGEAAKICFGVMKEESKRVRTLMEMLYLGIKEKLPFVILNGDYNHRIPNNLNLSFPYVEGESLLVALNKLALSSGSACTSASLEPSYVLMALGVDDVLAHSSVRFGIGRFTTEDEIRIAIDLIAKKVAILLEMSPLWEMVQNGIDLKSVQWADHH